MRRILLFMLGIGLAATAPAHGETQPTCPTSPETTLSLPIFSEALRQGDPIVIAAFGSSSTRGSQASSRAHSYPAILQAELNRRLPGAHVAIINRGVGGEDAARELVRLGRDVVALRPQLVIWQVGANAALRDLDPASFATTIAAGVRRLREIPADVILMDNQRAPRILAAPRREQIERAVTIVAKEQGVGFFSRGALMDAWQQQGHEYTQFLAPDKLHQNDRGYRCLAISVANAIVRAVRAEEVAEAQGAKNGVPLSSGSSNASSLSRR